MSNSKWNRGIYWMVELKKCSKLFSRDTACGMHWSSPNPLKRLLIENWFQVYCYVHAKVNEKV